MSGLSPFTLRHSLILLALLVRLASAQATPLFGTNGPAVREFRLQLPDASARSLRTEPRQYAKATVQVDDGPPLEVGVHLKGAAGSFQALDERPSLTVDFDRFRPGQNLDGFTKLHLNNSAEDPSRLNELLGHELFRLAGLPSPQVGHARVRLNGRDLGLYVLKEGFTDAFLKREFPATPGTLLEPLPGADVPGPFRADAWTSAAVGSTQLDLLSAACSTSDPAERERLWAQCLDEDRFLSFVAAEVLLAHRDGYALARNNYRILLPAGTGQAVFLPHGMDQLFAPPQLPWQPGFSGQVAGAWLATPDGQRRYEARFRELLPRLLDVPALTNQVRLLADQLKPFLSAREWTEVRTEAAALGQRIAQRADSVRDQLVETEFPNLSVGEAAILRGWRPEATPDGGVIDLSDNPDGNASLHVRAGPVTAAGWRRVVKLPPGDYQLTAQATTRGIRPLTAGRNSGAALRLVGDGLRSASVTEDGPAQRLELTFSVPPAGAAVDLRAELRARAGEVWFARDSLLLRRLR